MCAVTRATRCLASVEEGSQLSTDFQMRPRKVPIYPFAPLTFHPLRASSACRNRNWRQLSCASPRASWPARPKQNVPASRRDRESNDAQKSAIRSTGCSAPGSWSMKCQPLNSFGKRSALLGSAPESPRAQIAHASYRYWPAAGNQRAQQPPRAPRVR